jgi:hypothetical protein
VTCSTGRGWASPAVFRARPAPAARAASPSVVHRPVASAVALPTRHRSAWVPVLGGGGTGSTGNIAGPINGPNSQGQFAFNPYGSSTGTGGGGAAAVSVVAQRTSCRAGSRPPELRPAPRRVRLVVWWRCDQHISGLERSWRPCGRGYRWHWRRWRRGHRGWRFRHQSTARCYNAARDRC